MVSVTSTTFRKNVFTYLEQVAQGETISVIRNRREVARVVPPGRTDWRKRVSVKPRLLVSAQEVMAPVEDVWKDIA